MTYTRPNTLMILAKFQWQNIPDYVKIKLKVYYVFKANVINASTIYANVRIVGLFMFLIT